MIQRGGEGREEGNGESPAVRPAVREGVGQRAGHSTSLPRMAPPRARHSRGLTNPSMAAAVPTHVQVMTRKGKPVLVPVPTAHYLAVQDRIERLLMMHERGLIPPVEPGRLLFSEVVEEKYDLPALGSGRRWERHARVVPLLFREQDFLDYSAGRYVPPTPPDDEDEDSDDDGDYGADGGEEMEDGEEVEVEEVDW